jgi:hypothetical protein
MHQQRIVADARAWRTCCMLRACASFMSVTIHPMIDARACALPVNGLYAPIGFPQAHFSLDMAWLCEEGV